MKLAFLYAGQGAQHPGMGKDLYDAYPAFRAAFDAAAAAVPFDLKTLCFEGPAEQLADTRYTQPCMVAFAAGVTAVLQQAGIVSVESCNSVDEGLLFAAECLRQKRAM